MKIRKKIHADGRVELVRLISTDDSWSAGDPLAFERSIVWLRPVEDLPYVREKTVVGVRTRTGPLRVDGAAELVGYSTLSDDAPIDSETHGYQRRIFYLRPEDPRPGRPPKRAVDPTTVLPGVLGTRLRERSSERRKDRRGPRKDGAQNDP